MTKNAAVLCPGPSLVETYGPLAGTYDLVVAVNRAAGRFAADLWVMLDARTYAITEVIGRPTIVCS